MWSCLLLLFLFFWSNDALPRFKRGSRSFGTLTIGVAAFVVMFTLVHQDDAYQNKEQKCPPALDLSTWLGIDLANGAITLLVMFFVALRLGTPREHELAAYMYANALEVNQTHGQHKMFTAKGEMVPHDFSPKSAKYLVDHLDPVPSSIRLSSLRWVLLLVAVFDVILNCVGVWVLVEAAANHCNDTKALLFRCVAALVGLFFSFVLLCLVTLVAIYARGAAKATASRQASASPAR